MLTWEKFLVEKKGCDPHTIKAAKALEDLEEKEGKDLDNDNEEGEPAAHVRKVEKKD